MYLIGTNIKPFVIKLKRYTNSHLNVSNRYKYKTICDQVMGCIYSPLNVSLQPITLEHMCRQLFVADIRNPNSPIHGHGDSDSDVLYILTIKQLLCYTGKIL